MAAFLHQQRHSLNGFFRNPFEQFIAPPQTRTRSQLSEKVREERPEFKNCEETATYLTLAKAPGVDGMELLSKIQNGERARLTATEIRPLARGLVQALNHAEGRGVSPGDIKPHNVMLDVEKAALIDWGQACIPGAVYLPGTWLFEPRSVLITRKPPEVGAESLCVSGPRHAIAGRGYARPKRYQSSVSHTHTTRTVLYTVPTEDVVHDMDISVWR